MRPAAEIIQAAREAGVELAQCNGALSYSGPREAFERLRPTLAENKAEILSELAAAESRLREWWRQPVEGWPHRINIRNLATGKETAIELRGQQDR